MLTQPLSARRKRYAVGMRCLTMLSVLIAASLALSLIVYVMARGLPFLTLDFLTTGVSYLSGHIGILPNLLNTVYLIVTTLALTMPLGVGAAIYLNEYAANRKLTAVIEYAAETLSGIPSIIYGLVGMLLFSNRMGSCLLAGALTLTVMNFPTILRTTQESLKTVPQNYREGAFGLGAGKWRTIRTVVLPCCVDGILTGCLLSAGRILGESAALLFTAGFAHALNGPLDALFSAGATLSVALYLYAKVNADFAVAFAIAAVLMVLTVGIHLCAVLAGRYFKRRNLL